MKITSAAYLLAIAAMASCAHPKAETQDTPAPTSMKLWLCEGRDFHNVARMFDDSEVSAFLPEDMMVYHFRLDTPLSVDSVRLIPVRRRGYSTDYSLHTFSNGRRCTNNGISIKPDVHELSTLDIMVEYTGGDMERREFYRDSLPYLIELESMEQHKRVAFSGMEFYKDGRRINDTTMFGISGDIDDHCISSKLTTQYASKLDGHLLNRKLVYASPSAKCTFKIFGSGIMSVLVDGNLSHGLISENADGRLMLDLQLAPDGISSQQASLYINGHDIAVPAIGLDARYDGLDSDFLNLRNFPDLFQFEIRYATDNNFTHKVLYDAPICYLRYAPARDLIGAARDIVSADGLMIRMYDGYRPRKMQYVMWEVCPNPNFLSPPGKGSIHNRGGAVDLTLATPDGSVLDMGTDYDFCGAEAYTSNTNLPDTVLRNRQLLFDLMRRHRFNMIRTEWWHFSHAAAMQFGLEDFVPDEFVRF